MDTVRIRYFKETTCCLCLGEGVAVGIIKSYLSLLDVRAQIKEKGLKGYYLLWNNDDDQVVIIKIDEFGELDSYPKGFYDDSIKLLLKLV